MKVLVLDTTTPFVDAVVVAGEGAQAGSLAAAFAEAGVRVATYAGPPDDAGLAEMIAELFGADAEVVTLPR